MCDVDDEFIVHWSETAERKSNNDEEYETKGYPTEKKWDQSNISK